jgi:uncharacterized protein (TIGR02231 family)
MSAKHSEAQAKDGESIPVLHAPVAEVTLMEDRARVLRRGSLALAAGRHRVLVHGVAPILVDKSLLVETQHAGAKLRVVDAKVIREMVIRTASGADSEDAHAELVELRSERRALEKEIASAAAEIKRCEDFGVGLRRAGSLTLNEIVSDVSWGKDVDEQWSSKLASVRARHLESLDRLVLLNSQQEERQAKLGGLDARIILLQSPAEHEAARIAIELECDNTCYASFVLDYVVPGACWRPYHSAQLQGVNEERVLFKTDACVWQNTGEDWVDAQLVLSTERASLGATAPTLVTDFLSLKRRTDAVQIEARDESVDSLQDEDGTAQSTSTQLPGIDDGGSTLFIRVPRPATIHSDGRPHRLFLSEFETASKNSLVAAPELNPCVILATNFENAGESPLLAGPVDLIRRSGLVGHSQILYVASGERFDIGWGPEADLRVHREVESSSETSRVLSSWNVKSHLTRLRLSNLGQQSYSIRVTERVPVSEIEKVKIEVDVKRTTRKQAADTNGFVQWIVELDAMGQEELELHYQVKMHDDVQS